MARIAGSTLQPWCRFTFVFVLFIFSVALLLLICYVRIVLCFGCGRQKLQKQLEALEALDEVSPDHTVRTCGFICMPPENTE